MRDAARKSLRFDLFPLEVLDPEQPVMVLTDQGAVRVIDAVEGWLLCEDNAPFRPKADPRPAGGISPHPSLMTDDRLFPSILFPVRDFNASLHPTWFQAVFSATPRACARRGKNTVKLHFRATEDLV
jgi:hypothetical protein